MYHQHPTPYHGIAGFIEHSRVKTVYKFACVQPDDSVLEIGCEAGNLLYQCPKARRIVGADISSRALRDAHQLFKSNKGSA
jgi:cyclopropane fatty-acyl-phospholipid synthase-like methyltransferase